MVLSFCQNQIKEKIGMDPPLEHKLREMTTRNFRIFSFFSSSFASLETVRKKNYAWKIEDRVFISEESVVDLILIPNNNNADNPIIMIVNVMLPSFKKTFG